MTAKIMLGRRSLLKSVGAVALAGGLGGLSLRARADQPGEELWQPPIQSAVNGLLDTTVRARYSTYKLDGKTVSLRGYDGLPVGRSLRIQAGDRLRLHLYNELPWEPSGQICGANQPHALNTTNMHLHGVHVSPNQPSDYILLSLGPKTPLSPNADQQAMSDYQYAYEIGADHPPGTYWYHAHYHGSVPLQVASGMAGCLIIEGEVDRIPEIAAASERVLMIQSLPVDGNGAVEVYDGLSATAVEPRTYINGQYQPKITMAPGEVQRWRVINGTHNRLMWFGLADPVKAVLLCCDGNPLPKAELLEQSLRLVPGNRLDLLIKAPETPGSYAVQMNETADGTPGTLATVVVTGVPKPMPLFFGDLPSYRLLKSISAAEVQYGRRLTFGMTGAPQRKTYTINDIPFSCENPWEIPLGRVEEWEITNQTNDPHPFHIHVNAFQTVAGGNVPAGRWLDTVEVPPSQKVTLRTRFDDFTGLFVFHCHTLVHEDMGMMQAIKVV
jgi:FtsP/CotA-like multicopper oxidase with cupredoxin domain